MGTYRCAKVLFRRFGQLPRLDQGSDRGFVGSYFKMIQNEPIGNSNETHSIFDSKIEGNIFFIISVQI